MLINWFANLDPVLQALIATCFTWFLTALGASVVFVFKTVNRIVLDGMLGFTAMMILDVAFG